LQLGKVIAEGAGEGIISEVPATKRITERERIAACGRLSST